MSGVHRKVVVDLPAVKTPLSATPEFDINSPFLLNQESLELLINEVKSGLVTRKFVWNETQGKIAIGPIRGIHHKVFAKDIIKGSKERENVGGIITASIYRGRINIALTGSSGTLRDASFDDCFAAATHIRELAQSLGYEVEIDKPEGSLSKNTIVRLSES